MGFYDKLERSNVHDCSHASVEAEDVHSSTLVIENDSNSCMAKALYNSRNRGEVKKNLWIIGKETKLSEEEIYDENGNLTKIGEDVCNHCNQNRKLTSLPSVEMTLEGDWQSLLISPLQRFAQLYKLGHLSDLTLEFQDSDVVYKAHKLILATASPVFERMLYGSSAEALTGKVKMHCSPTPIRWVLDNLYLGKTTLPNVFTAIIVYDVAQMYQMTSIAALCRDFLKYEISMSNVTKIFDVALTHDEEALVKACLKKLCSSWPELLHEHISELTEDIWKYILRKDVLPTPEVELFNGLVRWSRSKLEKAEKMVTPQSIRAVMDKFLPNLRLLAIPSDKFIDDIMPTLIFTSDECSSILMKLRGVPAILPKTVRCSSTPHSRIETTDSTLKYVVLSRMHENRKSHPAVLTDIVLIKNFNVSNPILLYQIQTQDNSTLKHAQMIMSDEEGIQVGVASALGAQWRFVLPVFLYANKLYTITIDKVLVSKACARKEFCTYLSDIRFKGSTGDNFLKMSFWPAQIKSL